MNYLLSIFIFVNVFASCEQITESSEITTSTLNDQMENIRSLIDKGTCTDESSCRYMAYGSKACGGPVGYLIFSSDVNEALLKKMVASYTQNQKVFNEKNGIMSDCSIPPEPQQLKCENGKCVEIAVTH